MSYKDSKPKLYTKYTRKLDAVITSHSRGLALSHILDPEGIWASDTESQFYFHVAAVFPNKYAHGSRFM